ncbi:glycine cleavage system protein GcvH [Amphibacillus cookii]|uniref:glycine cleavage system protein GcvH n=1 Tax=Amphibacillus cookii TaxID=767787 RepID=UPI00195D4A74|nr:glycine cleavage system protein GcvH [Amphibacillus cookii]MBM7541466.1 glycine cleavage system H protein [Amphibacillus cookii]
MNLPNDLKYTEEHIWVREEGDSISIGVTDHAQDELGDVVFVELPEQGEQLLANDSFGSVESVKTVSELYVPVDGEVVKVNQALEDTPELVNDSPYQQGWLIQIRPTNPDQLKQLLDPQSYQKQLSETE